MTRYLENLNELTAPAATDWLRASSGTGVDADKKVSVGKFARLDASNTGSLIMGRTSLTIAAGVISAAAATFAQVDTEAGASADDLDTINGGTLGQILILMTVANTRDVTVKHGTGNIFLADTTDFVLSGTRDKLLLISTGTEWHEVGHSSNI